MQFLTLKKLKKSWKSLLMVQVYLFQLLSLVRFEQPRVSFLSYSKWTTKKAVLESNRNVCFQKRKASESLKLRRVVSEPLTTWQRQNINLTNAGAEETAAYFLKDTPTRVCNRNYLLKKTSSTTNTLPPLESKERRLNCPFKCIKNYSTLYENSNGNWFTFF